MEINKIFEIVGKLYIDSKIKEEYLSNELRQVKEDKENLIKLIEAAGINEHK